MSTVQIRMASAGDIPALTALRLAYLADDCGGYPQELPGRLPGYFTAHLGRDCFAAIGADSAGQAVSAAILVCTEMPPNTRFPHGRCGTVYSVYTAPEYRRQGIASAMIRMLLDTAEQQGLDRISLSATDAGRGIYEKAGFVCRASHYTEMEYIISRKG